MNGLSPGHVPLEEWKHEGEVKTGDIATNIGEEEERNHNTNCNSISSDSADNTTAKQVITDICSSATEEGVREAITGGAATSTTPTAAVASCTKSNEQEHHNNPLVTSDSSNASCCGAVSDSEISAVIQKSEAFNNNNIIATDGNCLVVDEDSARIMKSDSQLLEHHMNGTIPISPHQQQQPSSSTSTEYHDSTNVAIAAGQGHYQADIDEEHTRQQQQQQECEAAQNNNEISSSSTTAAATAVNPPAHNPHQPPQQISNRKPQNMQELHSKFMHELQYMMYEFRKLERQLLSGGTSLNTNIPETHGSRERREKLRSFILHLEDTMQQITNGCKKETVSPSSPLGESSTASANGGVVATSTSTSIAHNKEESDSSSCSIIERQNVQRLEEHILTNLLPVKERLMKQLSAQGRSASTSTSQGSVHDSNSGNASSLKRQRCNSMHPQQQQHMHTVRSMAGTTTTSVVSKEEQSCIGKQFTSGQGSSLTRKLHGASLGVHAGGGFVPCPIQEQNQPPQPQPHTEYTVNAQGRPILYAGAAPGADITSVSSSCVVASASTTATAPPNMETAPILNTTVAYPPLQMQRRPQQEAPQPQVIQPPTPHSSTAATVMPDTVSSQACSTALVTHQPPTVNPSIALKQQQQSTPMVVSQQQQQQAVTTTSVQAAATTAAPIRMTATPAAIQTNTNTILPKAAANGVAAASIASPRAVVVQQHDNSNSTALPVIDTQQLQLVPVRIVPTAAVQQTNQPNPYSTTEKSQQPQGSTSNPVSHTIQIQQQPATAALAAAIQTNASQLGAVIFKEENSLTITSTSQTNTTTPSNDLLSIENPNAGGTTKPSVTEEEEEQQRVLKRRRRKKRKRRKRNKRRRLMMNTNGVLSSHPNRTSVNDPYSDHRHHHIVGSSSSSTMPRPVEYTCSLCNETYPSSCAFNPWWALTQEDCRRCNKLQVPRIDISAPGNTIDYHPALLAHADDGGGNTVCTTTTTDNEDNTMQQQQRQQQILLSQQQQQHERQKLEYTTYHYESDSSLEGDDLDLSEDGTISDDGGYDSCDSDCSSSTIDFGRNYEGPTLCNEDANKLLTLIQHASSCLGGHKNAQVQQICNSTKYLMLHVRDCPGTTLNGDKCPYPWCLKVKHLLFHLVSCTDQITCPICSTIPTNNFSTLASVNARKQQSALPVTTAPIAAATYQTYRTNNTINSAITSSSMYNSTNQVPINTTNISVTANPLQAATVKTEEVNVADARKIKNCFPDVKMEEAVHESSITTPLTNSYNLAPTSQYLCQQIQSVATNINHVVVQSQSVPVGHNSPISNIQPATDEPTSAVVDEQPQIINCFPDVLMEEAVIDYNDSPSASDVTNIPIPMQLCNENKTNQSHQACTLAGQNFAIPVVVNPSTATAITASTSIPSVDHYHNVSSTVPIVKMEAAISDESIHPTFMLNEELSAPNIEYVYNSTTADLPTHASMLTSETFISNNSSPGNNTNPINSVESQVIAGTTMTSDAVTASHIPESNDSVLQSNISSRSQTVAEISTLSIANGKIATTPNVPVPINNDHKVLATGTVTNLDDLANNNVPAPSNNKHKSLVAATVTTGTNLNTVANTNITVAAIPPKISANNPTLSSHQPSSPINTTTITSTVVEDHTIPAQHIPQSEACANKTGTDLVKLEGTATLVNEHLLKSPSVAIVHTMVTPLPDKVLSSNLTHINEAVCESNTATVEQLCPLTPSLTSTENTKDCLRLCN